jgi:hypothetical protein
VVVSSDLAFCNAGHASTLPIKTFFDVDASNWLASVQGQWCRSAVLRVGGLHLMRNLPDLASAEMLFENTVQVVGSIDSGT